MNKLFTGLSAFPLTPLHHDQLDTASFKTLISRLVEAKVDSITVLGSTGSYAYLSPKEREQVLNLALQEAETTPVFVGVGDLRTSRILQHVRAAESAGAAGLLLAPMTYQALTDNDVYQLYRAVSESTDLPIIVYDNPGTTHFTFSTDLYARVAELANIASIKIPGSYLKVDEAKKQLAEIRSVIPEQVSIGISGDAFAAAGLLAGCDLWYSVLGGLLPEPALKLTQLALAGQVKEALEFSAGLAPLWNLFSKNGGSLRVVAAMAEELGLTKESCLPLPIQGLDRVQRAQLSEVLKTL